MHYTKNDNYWSEPNIENSYWAGFIAADGSVRYGKRSGYQLRLQLTESDKGVLDRLKLALEYSGSMRYIPGKLYMYKEDNRSGFAAGYTTRMKPQYYLEISGAKQYLLDLNKWYNITPNKTFTLQPPNITDINLIKAYIIGYFDGDGSLFIRNNKYCSPGIKIVGTRLFITWVKSVLEDLTNESFTLSSANSKARDNLNICALHKGGSGVYKFLDCLSDVNVPRLDRKWNLSI